MLLVLQSRIVLIVKLKDGGMPDVSLIQARPGYYVNLNSLR